MSVLLAREEEAKRAEEKAASPLLYTRNSVSALDKLSKVCHSPWMDGYVSAIYYFRCLKEESVDNFLVSAFSLLRVDRHHHHRKDLSPVNTNLLL